MGIAKRTDWKTKEMPQLVSSIELNKELSSDDLLMIQKGLLPVQMEDKWFVFYETPYLYFHRSWSGFCIYRVQITESASKILMLDATINRDKKEYNGDSDEYDKDMIIFLVERMLLSKPSTIPFPPNLSDEKKAIFSHSVIGYGRSNKES